MMRTWLAGIVPLVALLSAVLALSTACVSGSSEALDSGAVAVGTVPRTGQPAWPAALPVDQLQPWEHLDSAGRVVPQQRSIPPSSAGHGAASLNVQSDFVAGVERDSANGDVTDAGEASRLGSGAPGAKALSYAIYSISLGAEQPGVIAADVNLRPQADGSHSAYYLGLSDYVRGTWEWHGPFSDSHVRLSTGERVRGGAGYTSPLGRLHLCVAAFDGAQFDVLGLGLNRYDAADAAVPAAPAGLTATPAAAGLLLQWNSVIASDLAGYRIYWSSAPFVSPDGLGVSRADDLEGSTLRLLALLSTGTSYVAAAAVDISGNESALSTGVSATPLAGSAAPLEVTLSAPSVLRGEPVQLTASGATNYDIDLNGDGVFDLTNASGLANVDTSAPGIVRPRVRGTGDGGTVEALGGVSLIVSANSRPAASAIASPQSGISPLTVTFTGTAEDAEDAPAALTYAWDFNGDGNYEADTNTLTPAARVYNPVGLYNVKFRVTDSQGAWAADTVAVQIKPKTGVDSSMIAGSGVYSRSSAILVGGLLAAVYQDQATNNVYFVRATNSDATAWGAPVLVSTESQQVFYFSLNLVGGNPALAFIRADYGLEYVRATNAQGSAWSSVVDVLPSGTEKYTCELVEAANNPAIGYGDTTFAKPTFIRAIDSLGAAWTAPVAVDGGTTGNGCSTAIISGLPAMSYGDSNLTNAYYCRATDAAGSAWGAHYVLSSTQFTGITDLQVIGGQPCVAFRNDSGGSALFARSNNATGTSWHYPVLAWQRAEGLASPIHLRLAQFGGLAALAVVDSSDGTLWYTEASDPTGNQWQLPLVVAPYTPLHVVSGQPSLVDLNGVAAIVDDDYTDFSDIQLRVTRKYR